MGEIVKYGGITKERKKIPRRGSERFLLVLLFFMNTT